MAYYSTHGISQFIMNDKNKGYGFYWPILYIHCVVIVADIVFIHYHFFYVICTFHYKITFFNF